MEEREGRRGGAAGLWRKLRKMRIWSVGFLKEHSLTTCMRGRIECALQEGARAKDWQAEATSGGGIGN
jgi:hypothetical protein